MNEKNIVIGIEGLVGAGKTSISRELLNYIPNSIILHGGNIYRAIVYGIMKNGIDLKSMQNVDINEIMNKLGVNVKLEDRETVVYLNGEKIKEKDLQSDKSSIAVSKVSNIADNTKLYKFGKDLIDSFRNYYNIILSSRDIMKMYPDTTYHFFVKASLEERINRKYIQYNGKIEKEKIRETIEERDRIQEKTGYYKIYENTKEIDVTDCKDAKESTKKLLEYIKLEVNA